MPAVEINIMPHRNQRRLCWEREWFDIIKKRQVENLVFFDYFIFLLDSILLHQKNRTQQQINYCGS